MNDFPTIRVDFENMKHSMLTAINQHLDEISTVAEAQLKELLSDKKFLDSVRTQMELNVRHTIARSVEQSVNDQVRKHINDLVDQRWKKVWEEIEKSQA